MTFDLREADNRLDGRLALVTGASGGIGAACSRALASVGCDVALHYSSSQAAAKTLHTELTQRFPGQNFSIHQADLSDAAATRSLVPSVATRHRRAVEVLVANAGWGKRTRDPADISEDDWDGMMAVNARATFVVVRSCLEGGMRNARWGRVVVIGSIASKGGGINGCHYAASKGAITSMALNLATVLAPENITVNVVSPAMIGSTGMIPAAKRKKMDTTQQDPANDVGLSIAATIPMGRLGEPEEVAHAVIMFVKTGYITGQDFLISGGLK